MGGIETQVSGLVDYQRKEGHEVFVLTLTPGPEINGVKRFPFRLPNELLWNPNGLKLVTSALEELSPDIVHLHLGAASPFAWNGINAVRNLDLPSVATVHSIWGSVAKRMYAGAAKKISRKTIFSSVSKTACDIVSSSLNRDVKLTHNGVDIEFWSEVKNLESPRIQIVSATRFAARKRIRPQIMAIEKIVRELGDKSPHFTIAGTGPDFARIQKLIQEKNLTKNIELVGRLDKLQLRNLYSRADIFMQMSLLEAFGIAACEARAAGLPVISRAGSGVSEFVKDGSTGYLESTDEKIVERIVELVNDREKLRKLKNKSSKQPPVQNWAHAASQIDALYQQAIQQV